MESMVLGIPRLYNRARSLVAMPSRSPQATALSRITTASAFIPCYEIVNDMSSNLLLQHDEGVAISPA